MQSFEPTSLRLPAHAGVPVRTDHCDRKDEYPLALLTSAVGQKERCQEERPGAGGTGRGKLSSPSQGGRDRQPRHTRGHLGLRHRHGGLPIWSAPPSCTYPTTCTLPTHPYPVVYTTSNLIGGDVFIFLEFLFMLLTCIKCWLKGTSDLFKTK